MAASISCLSDSDLVQTSPTFGGKFQFVCMKKVTHLSKSGHNVQCEDTAIRIYIHCFQLLYIKTHIGQKKYKIFHFQLPIFEFD